MMIFLFYFEINYPAGFLRKKLKTQGKINGSGNKATDNFQNNNFKKSQSVLFKLNSCYNKSGIYYFVK